MEIALSETGLPILDQFSEEGFIDCVFKIINLEEQSASYRFDLRAFYQGAELGFAAEVIKGMQGGFDEDVHLIKKHVYRQGVTFYRTGPESDRLINTLSQLYGLSESPQKMCEAETFTAIVLHQGEIDMESEEIKIKLFGKDQATDLDENYYESFFNLDLPSGFVFWNEKDLDYREPLIRGLSG